MDDAKTFRPSLFVVGVWTVEYPGFFYETLHVVDSLLEIRRLKFEGFWHSQTDVGLVIVWILRALRCAILRAHLWTLAQEKEQLLGVPLPVDFVKKDFDIFLRLLFQDKHLESSEVVVLINFLFLWHAGAMLVNWQVTEFNDWHS